MFVGEAPGRQRGRAGRPVRRPGRASCSRSCSARSGSRRDDVFIANALEVPPARQPRPAAAGDRQLPGVALPPARADRAEGGLHARQLRHEAAARRARPASRGCTARPRSARIGPRTVRLLPLYHPAAALYTPLPARRRCARTSPASRRCSRCPRPDAARPRASPSPPTPRRRRARTRARSQRPLEPAASLRSSIADLLLTAQRCRSALAASSAVIA